jgi:integrase
MQREFLYRKGKYIYFRQPGTKVLIRLPDDENSTAFEQAYGPLYRAAKGSNKPPRETREVILTAQESRFAQGTIGWFVEEYLTNKVELNRNIRRDCDVMREHRIAHAQLHSLTPENVDHYSGEIAIAYAATTADRHITLISNLWKFARTYPCFQRGDKHNPTIDRIRHHKADADGHLAWPDDVIDRFDARAIAERPDLHRFRLGLHYTGQRGGDVVAMKWADYNRGKIHVMQEKTGERVWIACPAPLRALLETMPRVSENIFTNSRGKPYGGSENLSNALRIHLRACGFTDYSMHGLRKNAGMELALAGCNPNEIMAVLGHRSPKMAMFYCAQASKIKLAETASAKWNVHIEAEALQRAEDKASNVTVRRRQIKAVA